jgi:hypothetical protein
MVLAEGRSLIEQRNRIEARAVELSSGHPDYQLLTTALGTGPIKALTTFQGAGHSRQG